MEFDLTRVDESWKPFFDSWSDHLESLQNKLVAQNSQGEVLPAASDIFNAFSLPVSKVKVLIMGQDPYPTPGHAHGLAFSVRHDVGIIPRSLVNIFKELQDDVGCVPPLHGDLSQWHNQGVLLLNRVLSVQSGEAGSHRKLGWEEFTFAAVEYLALHNPFFVGILWGSDAHLVKTALTHHSVLCSVHPSPLSAHRGFFGSKPFSFVNLTLGHSGQKPIDWCIQ